jgi:hypothetical protein
MGMGDGLSGRPAAVDTDVHAIHSIRPGELSRDGSHELEEV